MKKESGQVILILLLLITVALGIGLSVVQRSLSDVSTSTRVEESSRAFSAAEAGIERALRGGETTFNLENSSVSVQSASIPANFQAFEYPPLSKEEIAQVWLVDPGDLISQQYPINSTLSVYWGDPSISEVAAILLSFVYLDGSGSYKTQKFFYDLDSGRRSTNGFADPGNCAHSPTVTSLSTTARGFKCRVVISINNSTFPGISRLMLVRARLLYSTVAQPFAVEPESGRSLPKQAQFLVSTGTFGETQRKVQLLQVEKVVPFYFDYAIFSAGDITK